MNTKLLAPLCLTVGIVPVFALDKEDASSVRPHETVLSSVHALRNNDVGALVRSMLSDAEVAEAAAEWDVFRATEMTPEDEAEFQAAITRLTGDGAEDLLMEELLPKLEEMRPQMAMLAGMFTGMGQAMILEQETLDDEQKEKSARMLAAVSELLVEADLCDPVRARKAVGFVCAAARDLNLSTTEDLRALTFDQLLERSNLALSATKQVFALYGFRIDEFLDTIQAETVTESGEHAVVKVSYEFLGVQEETEVELQRTDGRWVRRDEVVCAPVQ
jgi:hypothetical protein